MLLPVTRPLGPPPPVWRRALTAWSLMPAVAATALLAGAAGAGDTIHRAERVVAAQLSWCGVNERTVAIERAHWVSTRQVDGREADVVVVPVTGDAGWVDGLTVLALPTTSGGWEVRPGDRPTAEIVGHCFAGGPDGSGDPGEGPPSEQVGGGDG